MTEEETGKVLAEITAFWPNFLAHRDPKVTVNVWHRAFAEMPYEAVSAAVVYYAETENEGFAPSVGKLMNVLTEAADPSNKMTELEAWVSVSNALKNGLYGYQEEYAKLPALVQETIGDPSILREWAMLDENEVQTVVASNFQRSFRAKQESQSTRIKVPDAIRTALHGKGLQGIADVVNGLMASQPKPMALTESNITYLDTARHQNEKQYVPSLDEMKDYFAEKHYKYGLIAGVMRVLEESETDDWKKAVDDLLEKAGSTTQPEHSQRDQTFTECDVGELDRWISRD